MAAWETIAPREIATLCLGNDSCRRELCLFRPVEAAPHGRGFPQQLSPPPERRVLALEVGSVARRTTAQSRGRLPLRDREARACRQPVGDLGGTRDGAAARGRPERAHRSAFFRARLANQLRGAEARGAGGTGACRAAAYRRGGDLA